MANKLTEKVEEARTTRAVFTYTVPVGMGGDIKSVGLVELTASEELMAAKRASGEGARLAYEMAKTSLVEVNGSKVGLADGSADSAWNKMPPKVRNLVIQAFASLHAPPEDDAASFLASRQVRV